MYKFHFEIYHKHQWQNIGDFIIYGTHSLDTFRVLIRIIAKLSPPTLATNLITFHHFT